MVWRGLGWGRTDAEVRRSLGASPWRRRCREQLLLQQPGSAWTSVCHSLLPSPPTSCWVAAAGLDPSADLHISLYISVGFMLRAPSGVTSILSDCHLDANLTASDVSVPRLFMRSSRVRVDRDCWVPDVSRARTRPFSAPNPNRSRRWEQRESVSQSKSLLLCPRKAYLDAS